MKRTIAKFSKNRAVLTARAATTFEKQSQTLKTSANTSRTLRERAQKGERRAQDNNENNRRARASGNADGGVAAVAAGFLFRLFYTVEYNARERETPRRATAPSKREID